MNNSSQESYKVHAAGMNGRKITASWLFVLPLLLLLTACASLQTGEPADVIHEGVHSGGSAIVFSESGNFAASGGWEGTVRLWQLPAGDEVLHWQAHADSVNGIAFVDDDRQIITAGFDGVLARRAIDGHLLERITTPAPITHMVADAQADRLLTGHNDGTVRLWQASDFALISEVSAHRGAVKAVAIAPGAGSFASSAADGTVVLWDGADRLTPLETPPADAWTLAFSPDGRVLTGGSWFRLFRWDLASGIMTTIPTEHHGIIKSIEYTDNGNTLATISRQTDSAVYFMDPISGAVTRRFQRHDLCGGDLSVSPQGRYLATTSDDASVRFWVLDGAGEQRR